MTGAALLMLAAASGAPVHADEVPKSCSNCAVWNVPRSPFKIHGNTYYVGSGGLSAVLVTSPQGHILIDGGLSQSAAVIAGNIAALGFEIRDVKWLLNSHAHFDHAGGLAALQRLSGARVAASPESRLALQAGNSLASDPQAGYGEFMAFPAVKHVKAIGDGDSIALGGNVLSAVFTTGHSPGGTTWTWPSCEAGDCLSIVYADSLNPVSHDAYLYSRHPDYVASFRQSIDSVRKLKCDILVSAHPEQSGLIERAETGSFIDAQACRRYADTAAERLDNRLGEETAVKKPD